MFSQNLARMGAWNKSIVFTRNLNERAPIFGDALLLGDNGKLEFCDGGIGKNGFV